MSEKPITPVATDGVVFAFGGQGSQYPGMGRELYRHDSFFRTTMNRIDTTASRLSRVRLIDELEGDNIVRDIRASHLAIFSIQYSLAASLINDGLSPSYVLGLSTGEFAAAVISGALELEEALFCVVEQADALATLTEPGGMLAVGAPPPLFDQLPVLAGQCELALTGTGHFVVAGGADAIRAAADELAQRSIPHRLLPVREGFHSPMIDPAMGRYLRMTSGRVFGRPRIGFGSCSAGGIVTESPRPDHFWWAIRARMRPAEAADAIARHGRYQFVDLGPGTAISVFLRKSQIPTAGIRSLLSPQADERRTRLAVRELAGSPR